MLEYSIKKLFERNEMKKQSSMLISLTNITIVLLYIYAIFVFMNLTYPKVLHDKKKENPFALFSMNEVKENIMTIKEINQNMNKKVKLSAYINHID